MTSLPTELLPPADPITGAELVHVVQDGNSRQSAIASIFEAFVGAATGGLASVTRYALTRDALASAAFTGVPAYLAEAGRKGWFAFDASDLSELVAADVNQGIYVAAAGDPTGAAGAWVRQFDGPAIATWFGASPASSAAANAGALNQALATLNALAIPGGYGNGGSFGLHVPAGQYDLDAELVVDHALSFTGDFVGGFSGGGTILNFNNATSGISVSKDVGTARISGFYIQGNAGVTSATAGLKCRGKVLGERMMIAGFGRGIECIGHFTAEGTNCNGAKFSDIATQSNGWGTWSEGEDANNIRFENVAGIGNAFGGHADHSFLGNTYDGGDLSSNGNDVAHPTRCSSGTHVYAVRFGQEAWCSANAPTGAATSNQGWLYLGETGAAPAPAPAWAAAMTWYFSAPFTHSNNNARSHFLNIYVELDQNPCIVDWPCRVDCAQQYVAVLSPNGAAYQAVSSVEWPGILSFGYADFKQGLQTEGNLNVAGRGQFQSGALVGWDSDPGFLADADLTIGNWNEYSSLTFKRQGAAIGSFKSAFGKLYASFDGFEHRTTGDLVVASLDAVGRNWTFHKDGTGAPSAGAGMGMSVPGTAPTSDIVFSIYNGAAWLERGRLTQAGNFSITGDYTIKAGHGLTFRNTANTADVAGVYNDGSGGVELDVTTGLYIFKWGIGAPIATLDEATGLTLPAGKKVKIGLAEMFLDSEREWSPQFTAAGDLYIPAKVAMTIDQGNAKIGAGAITYTKSTAAAPGVFGAAALPVTLEAGAWLKVSSTGAAALHLVRTA